MKTLKPLKLNELDQFFEDDTKFLYVESDEYGEIMFFHVAGFVEKQYTVLTMKENSTANVRNKRELEDILDILRVERVHLCGDFIETMEIIGEGNF